MMKILLFIFLLVGSINLLVYQKNVSQEVIQHEYKSDIYIDFTNNPQSIKEKLKTNDSQAIPELLQGILLNQEKPSEATLKAFSQLFAETYCNATNSDLSRLQNETYTQIFGMIIGSLSGLREQVLSKRQERFLAWRYNYDELDKRWLALFTDIIPLTLSNQLPSNVIKVSRTNFVNEFAESLIKNPYAIQRKDLVEETIYRIIGAATARFNGYLDETGYFVRRSFDATRIAAKNDMKHLINTGRN